MDSLLSKSIPAISFITEIELLCWKSTSAKDILALKDFITDCLIVDLNEPIKQRTVEIRKNYSIKLPDAIIAATALENKLTLISRNAKDFSRIEGLTLLDPFSV